MEEAERLCARVGIIDHGQVIALDTVPALIHEHAADASARFTLSHPVSPSLDLEALHTVTSVSYDGQHLSVHGTRDFIQEVLSVLTDHDPEPLMFTLSRPGWKTCS